mgnify:CR=1 FL=1
MSNTYHHSKNWGPHARYRHNRDGRVYSYRYHQLRKLAPERSIYGSSREASEGPCWFSHMHSIVPGRTKDKQMTRRFIRDVDLADEVVMPFTGTRRPHMYYW